MDKWERIWSNHHVNIEEGETDKEKIFFALKRASGYDLGENMPYQTFLDEYERMKVLLRFDDLKDTVYEVGCGAGANLWLFQNDGIIAEGCDYAPSLVEEGTKAGVKGMSIGRAEDFPVEPEFSSVIAGGLFGYLHSEVDAENVLDRMLDKARSSICVKRVLNKDNKEELIKKRRETEEDYDKKYDGLEKLYLDKNFFYDYARSRDMECFIEDTYMEGYWNNGYTFDVYIYKQ